MVDTVNAAGAVEALDKWVREYEGVIAIECMAYVREFRSYLATKSEATPVTVVLSWDAASVRAEDGKHYYQIPTDEALFATFERMAYSVFPADFAAEATRLVRNEPKRASDPTLERIADALECLALATGSLREESNPKSFRVALDGAMRRVIATITGDK